MAGIQLRDYQLDAVRRMKNGCILCGGVGSGKSRTALAYYYLCEDGEVGTDEYVPMGDPPKDLYIITTARKRDTCEWEGELSPFLLSPNHEVNLYSNKVVIDSWNNIQKYAEVQKELPLDKAGLNVLFMPDIKSFREKKVRILNGSHTGMAPIALLSGCDTVLDAFETPDINRFINDMTEREVLSVMDGDISELRSFSRDILERFHNPFMRHMLKSIALNSLSKWETRNFPTVRDFYNKKGLIADFEIFTFAALMALYSPYSGFIAEDDAANIDVIQGIWADGGDYIDIVRKITGSGIFTDNFEEAVPGFSQRAGEYLRSIMTDGMDRSLTLFLNTRCNEKNIENT